MQSEATTQAQRELNENPAGVLEDLRQAQFNIGQKHPGGGLSAVGQEVADELARLQNARRGGKALALDQQGERPAAADSAGVDESERAFWQKFAEMWGDFVNMFKSWAESERAKPKPTPVPEFSKGSVLRYPGGSARIRAELATDEQKRTWLLETQTTAR